MLTSIDIAAESKKGAGRPAESFGEPTLSAPTAWARRGSHARPSAPITWNTRLMSPQLIEAGGAAVRWRTARNAAPPMTITPSDSGH